MIDPHRLVHRQVPLANRCIWSLLFVLQHLFPRSRKLSALRSANAACAARRMKPGRVLEVERRSSLGEREFVEKYLKRGIPVVFEGQARDWPCTRKWSLDHLAQEFGSEPFSIIDIPGLDGDRAADAVARESLRTKVPARDFVRLIRSGRNSYVRACPILESRPELLEDLDLSWLKRMRRSLLGVSFQSFIGSGKQTTTLHGESTAFFFVLPEGEKRWTLFSAASSAILDPLPEGRGYVTTRLKLREPDLGLFPGFDKLTRYSCLLKKGDVLFVPAWMWHEVETLNESWGVSYRFTHLRGFLAQPALAFVRLFLAKPPLLRTLYYSYFGADMTQRDNDLLVPRLFLKD